MLVWVKMSTLRVEDVGCHGDGAEQVLLVQLREVEHVFFTLTFLIYKSFHLRDEEL